MSLIDKIRFLFHKEKPSDYYPDTELDGEYLDDPDIYFKMIDNEHGKFLFTNKDNEWSTFEALHEDERQRYVNIMMESAFFFSAVNKNINDHRAKQSLN